MAQPRMERGHQTPGAALCSPAMWTLIGAWMSPDPGRRVPDVAAAGRRSGAMQASAIREEHSSSDGLEPLRQSRQNGRRRRGGSGAAASAVAHGRARALLAAAGELRAARRVRPQPVDALDLGLEPLEIGAGQLLVGRLLDAAAD